MRPENINTVCHRWILETIKNTDICVDMTMGNGFDTLFLAENCLKVYAFDIQEDAINNTKERTKSFDNVELILDSHANFDKYINEKINIFVFNLGYLPKGDESITTKVESTIEALRKIQNHINMNGSVFITFYVGHAEGKKEHDTFLNLFDTLNYQIIRSYDYVDRHDSPILYQLQIK